MGSWSSAATAVVLLELLLLTVSSRHAEAASIPGSRALRRSLGHAQSARHLMQATVLPPPAPANDTGFSPPPAPAPPPPSPSPKGFEHVKDELHRSKGEMAVAITFGVLLLLGMCTCAVLCLFRKGGEWRLPRSLKKIFSREKPYTKYQDTTGFDRDDGF